MTPDPSHQRRFAEDVVRRLRSAGHEALWAGGCVRDELLGRLPKDYDVATDARPEQVSEVFGRRRTLAVGKAFGVMIVLGPQQAGQIDVATFRRDAAYSDGRHPDDVVFSSAEEDAQRRDFTINGLFYDPLNEEIIDYVDGQRDLERRLVRTIGSANDRFGEDKLRLLRAVRFAAALDFTLEENTRAAIAEMAGEITAVSGERIAQELRVMLGGATRDGAMREGAMRDGAMREGAMREGAARLLAETGLLAALLPEVPLNDPAAIFSVLARLDVESFPAAMAVLLGDLTSPQVRAICRRLRLTGKEAERVVRLIQLRGVLAGAAAQPWSQLQRVLVGDGAAELVALHLAEAGAVSDAVSDDAAFCREKLALPADVLNPPPLLTGEDLLAQGLAPGAIFRTLLEQVRNEQLEGRIVDRAEALALVQRLLDEE